MPVYAYKCRSCEETFDARQKFSDDPLTDCQVCGAEDAVYRTIQPAGIIFKGSGWYVTDSRTNRENLTKNGNETTSSEKTDSTTSTDSSSSTTSDSKKSDSSKSASGSAENVA